MNRIQIYAVFTGLMAFFISCDPVEFDANNEVIAVNVLTTGPYYADGITPIEVEVSVQKNADVAFNQIKFTTDAGSFEFDLVQLQNKKAIGKYIPETQAKTVNITCAIDGKESVFTNEQIVLENRPVHTILDIDITNGIQIADGQNILDGVFSFNNYQSSKITLVTSHGKFLSNQSKSMEFNMKSGDSQSFKLQLEKNAGNYQLTATVAESILRLDTILNIQPALPDSIFIQPTSFEIDSANGSSDIEILLFRNIGEVSNGRTFSFTVYQNDRENEVGRITNLPVIYDDGKATATFALDTRRANPGDITFEVKTASSTGELTKSVNLEVFSKNE